LLECVAAVLIDRNAVSLTASMGRERRIFVQRTISLRRIAQDRCAGRLTRPTPRTSTPTASSTAPT
jgi:hypothetical protein